MSELDKYIRQFQSYAKQGRALFPAKAIAAPVKPNLPEEETKALEVIVNKVSAVVIAGKTASLFKDFIAEDFDKKVAESVVSSYGEDNPCTHAYRAKDLGLITGCDDIDDCLEYHNYLVSCYEAAFAFIWGEGYDNARDNVSKAGCPTCTNTCCGFSNIDSKAKYMGIKYYVILRQLRSIQKQLEQLKALKERGIDWKKKLDPTMQTLYGIGGLASELLK